MWHYFYSMVSARYYSLVRTRTDRHVHIVIRSAVTADDGYLFNTRYRLGFQPDLASTGEYRGSLYSRPKTRPTSISKLELY